MKSAEQIRSVREAYRTVYRLGLTLEEAIGSLEESSAGDAVLATFIESLRGSRGLIR